MDTPTRSTRQAPLAKTIEKLAKLSENTGCVVVPIDPEKKSPRMKWGAFSRYAREYRPDATFPTNAPVSTMGALVLDSMKTPWTLIVLDADTKNDDVLNYIVNTFGKPGGIVETERGFHYYYRSFDGERVKQGSHCLGPNVYTHDGKFRPVIDIKAAASYVIAPGSMKKNGFEYKIVSGNFTHEAMASWPRISNTLIEAEKKTRKTRENTNKRHTTATKNDDSAKQPRAGGNGYDYDKYRGVDTIPQSYHDTHGDTCPIHDHKVGHDPVTLQFGGTVLRCHDCQWSWKITPNTVDTLSNVSMRAFAGEFLPDDLQVTARTTIVRSHLGSGKTHWALRSRTYENVTAANKTTRYVFVTPYQALTTEIAARSQGVGRLNLVNYKDVLGPIDKSCAVTVNSIHRVTPPTENETLVVIIDEVRAVREAFIGDTMKGTKARETLWQLGELTKSASAIIAMDSHAAQIDVDFVRQLSLVSKYENTDVVYTTYNNGRVLHITKNDTDILREMAIAVKSGEKIAVGMFGKHSTRDVERFLKKMRDNVHVDIVTADSREELALQGKTTDQINEWAAKTDVLIYNTAIGAGVSIDVPFDRLFVLAYNGASANMISQLTGRVRNLKNKNIITYVYGGAMKGHTRDDIERRERSGDILIRSSADRSKWAGALTGLRSAFIEFCHAEGIAWEHYDTDTLSASTVAFGKEYNKIFRALRSERKTSDLEKLKSANTHDGTKTATVKSELMDFYGCQITDDIAEFHMKRGGMTAAKLLAAVKAVLIGAVLTKEHTHEENTDIEAANRYKSAEHIAGALRYFPLLSKVLQSQNLSGLHGSPRGNGEEDGGARCEDFFSQGGSYVWLGKSNQPSPMDEIEAENPSKTKDHKDHDHANQRLTHPILPIPIPTPAPPALGAEVKLLLSKEFSDFVDGCRVQKSGSRSTYSGVYPHSTESPARYLKRLLRLLGVGARVETRKKEQYVLVDVASVDVATVASYGEMQRILGVAPAPVLRLTRVALMLSDVEWEEDEFGLYYPKRGDDDGDVVVAQERSNVDVMPTTTPHEALSTEGKRNRPPVHVQRACLGGGGPKPWGFNVAPSEALASALGIHKASHKRRLDHKVKHTPRQAA